MSLAMPKPATKNQPSPIRVPTDADDAAIIAAANADRDALPLTDEQLARMVPLRTLPIERKR